METQNELLYIQWGVVICASLVAAVTDIRTRRIPNVLTITLFFSGLIFNFLNYGGIALLNAFGASIVLAIPFILLYAFAGGGAGDAKLMGAIGAWLGLQHGIYALLVIVVTGAVFALGFALLHRQFIAVMNRFKTMAAMVWMFTLHNRGRGVRYAVENSVSPQEMLYMPYGVAICAGMVLYATGVMIWPA